MPWGGGISTPPHYVPSPPSWRSTPPSWRPTWVDEEEAEEELITEPDLPVEDSEEAEEDE